MVMWHIKLGRGDVRAVKVFQNVFLAMGRTIPAIISSIQMYNVNL